MDGAEVDHRASTDRSTVQQEASREVESGRPRPVGRDSLEDAPVGAQDHHLLGVAQPRGVLGDGIEDGPELGGDEAMALRMSAVAVCRSSALLSAALRCSSCSNRRAFSMAITAWSAKVSARAMRCAVNGRTRLSNERVRHSMPTKRSRRSSGTTRMLR